MNATKLAALVLAVVVIGGGVGWFSDFGAAAKAVAKLTTPSPGASSSAVQQVTDYTIDTTRSEHPSTDAPPYPGGHFYHPPTSGCVLPWAGSADRVVLFGAYEGASISSVSLDGFNGETRVADVEIEPGKEPLYLIMSSFLPTIWRFTGATERVSKLVLLTMGQQQTRQAPVGEIGIPENLVLSNPLQSCFREFSEPSSMAATEALGVVKLRLGRTPDVVAGLYSTYKLRLPSGLAAKADPDRVDIPAGFDRDEWAEATRFAPGGLATIDPAEVKGSNRATAYDILPNQMGLAQLLGEGALERAPGAFKIVKPIAHFPAALTGSHATSFILAQGVPTPSGSPGHSCVMSGATGQPLYGCN